MDWMENINIDDLDEYQLRKIKWIKSDACSNCSDLTKYSYYNMINSKIHPFEEALNKDLYKFSENELLEILNSMATSSLTTADKMASMIRKYIDWTYEIGLNHMGNPMNSLFRDDYYGNINSKALKESYMNKLDFINFVMDLECSYSDKLLLLLLRYGVKLKETALIKWEDVDKENKVIKLTRNGYDINIEIDYIFLEVLDKAKNEFEYSYISEVESTRKATGDIYIRRMEKVIEYSDCGYLIKNTNFKATGKDAVKVATLYTRINSVVKRNNIDKIDIDRLNLMCKFDKLFEVLHKQGKVTIYDVVNVIKHFDGVDTPPKRYLLRDNFELVAGIEIDRAY
ncbi:hypothetical protein AB2T90_11185 [Clostridium butyricum]|uniref:phage lytic cycle repressor MrpR family protein n=1 Tax=Clostridium butyricum TaxID=1492 RepID=UPI003465CEBF